MYLKRNLRLLVLYILVITVTTIATSTIGAATPTPTITPSPTGVQVPTMMPTPTMRPVTPTPRASSYVLTVYYPGSGGTVEITGPTPPPFVTRGGSYTFSAGASVYLYALTGDFRYWVINSSTYTSRGITVTMNGNKTVYVQFGDSTSPTPTGSRVTPTLRPTLTPTPTPTPTVTGDNVVSYTIQSDWGTGATVDITIKNNTTAAVNGWTLTWSFPGNQTITNLWNGSFTQNGASVSVKDAGHNATISANGGTVNFGFNLNYSGTNAKPTSFTLNGVLCRTQ